MMAPAVVAAPAIGSEADATAEVGPTTGPDALPGANEAYSVTDGESESASIAEDADATEISLITGQTIEVYEHDGETQIVTDSSEVLHQVETPEGTYVFPDGVDFEVFDPALFNVDTLIEEGLTDAESDDIPVIIEAREKRAVDGTDTVDTANVEGFQHGKSLSLIGATAGTVEKAAAAETLTRLFDNHEVDRVYLDATVEVDIDTSSAHAGADDAREKYDVNGSGVTVAVLDTGVDATHPDLEDAVVDQADFTDDGVGDVDGHGTHVAGTIAGDGSGDGDYVGVAPGADIVDVKVLGDDGSGSISDIVEGIEYATAAEVDVISMSIGGPGSIDNPVNNALDVAMDDGITVVVAAGNAGPEYGTMGQPASNERAITVGAYDHAGEEMAPFSSRGPTTEQRHHGVDLVAPGVNIASAQVDTDGYMEASGTSMAAPHVSGAAALLLERKGDMTNDEVRRTLLSTADPLYATDTHTQGSGYLNITRAMEPELVLDDPMHNFGAVSEDGNITTTITFSNPSDTNSSLVVEPVFDQVGDDEHYTGQIHLNETEVDVEADGTATVELTVNATVPVGDYSGQLYFYDQEGDQSFLYGFALARGSQLTVEKQPLSDDGTTEGDDVWIMTAEEGPQILTLTGGTAETIVADDEYTVWSSGMDEPTDTPVLLSETVSVDGDTTVELDEGDTVEYSYDDSALEHNLTTFQTQVAMLTMLESDDVVSEYVWRTRYTNTDIDTVRYSASDDVEAGINYVAAADDVDSYGYTASAEHIYQFVHATDGVTGNETLELLPEEFATEDRTYARNIEESNARLTFHAYSERVNITGSSSGVYDIGGEITEQQVHVRTTDAWYFGSYRTDNVRMRNAISPFDRPDPGETVPMDYNQHPFTSVVSIDGTADEMRLDGWLQVDQPEQRLENAPFDGFESNFDLRKNGETIASETNEQGFHPAGIDVDPGDNLELHMIGGVKESALSSMTKSVYEFEWRGGSDTAVPEIASVDIPTDETNVAHQADDGTIEFTVTVESEDGIADLHVRTAPETPDVEAFQDGWDDEWLDATVEQIAVDEDAGLYEYAVTIDASDYEDRPSFAVQATDTFGDSVTTHVENAFYVGEPLSDETISGTLYRADGEPAANHTVLVAKRGENMLYDEVVTNADGSFAFEAEPGGIYDLSVFQHVWGDNETPPFPLDGNVDIYSLGSVDLRTSGTADSTTEGGTMERDDLEMHSISSNEAEMNELREDPSFGEYILPEGNLVNVTLVDADNEPVSGGNVSFSDADREGDFFGIRTITYENGLAGENGGYELNGSAMLTVQPPDDVDAFADRFRVPVNADEPRNITINVEEQPDVTVSGSVVDADGEPVTPGTVTFDSSEEASTNVDGTFEFNTAGYQERALGFFRTDENGNFVPTHDGTVDLHTFDVLQLGKEDVDVGERTLPDGYVLDVEVVDEHGEPVEHAIVSIASIDADHNQYTRLPTQEVNENGQLVYDGADGSGLEVTGPVMVDVIGSSDEFEEEHYHTVIDVTDDETVTATLVRGETEEVTAIGRINLANGEPAAHDRVTVGGGDRTYTNEEGEFALEVRANSSMSLGYYRNDDSGFAPVKDGSPDVAWVTKTDVGDEDVDLGNMTLPDAHTLDVNVTDEDDDPVEDANVRILVHHNESYFGTGTGPSTNVNGYLDFESFDGTGIEVVGDVTVQVLPPGVTDHDHPDVEEVRLTVTEDETVNVTLTGDGEPEDVTITGQLLDADGEPASNDTVAVSQRESGDWLYQWITTNETGHFEVAVESGYTYDIGYKTGNLENNYSDLTPHDGTVDHISIASVDLTDNETTTTVSGTSTDGTSGFDGLKRSTTNSDVAESPLINTTDPELGTIDLPVGHQVTVTVVDEAGDPVENANVIYEDITQLVDDEVFLGGGVPFRTRTDGQAYFGTGEPSADDDPGMELNGTSRITVAPPEDDERFLDQEYIRNVTVDKQTNITVTLEEKETVTMNGTVELADGSAASEDRLHVAPADPGIFTDTNGEFSIEVSSNSSYRIGYYSYNEGQFAPVRDGGPDVYTLRRFDVGDESHDLGTLTLPDAHVIDVNVTDENGTPIEGADIRIVAHPDGSESSGFGTGFHAPTTNADGYLEFESFDGTGIELAGNVTVQVRPPEDDDRFKNETVEKSLTVDGDEEVQFTLEDSDDELPDESALTVVPEQDEVAAGDTVTVNVTVDAATDVVAVDTLLNVDPDLFTVEDVEYGPFLSQDGADTTTIDPRLNETTGEIETGESRNVEAGVAGEGTVVTLTLRATENVTQNVETSITVTEADVLDENDESVPLSTTDADLTITPPPLEVNASLEHTVNTDQPANLTVTVANATENTSLNISGVEGYERTETEDGWVYTITFTESTWNGAEDGSYEQTSIDIVATDTDRAADATVETAVYEPADISGDGQVALLDLRLLALAYGSEEGDAHYNPDADLTNDGTVGLDDLTLLSQHWRSVAWDDTTSAFTVEDGLSTIESVRDPSDGITAGI